MSDVVLRVQQLSKSYGALKAVDGLSLDVHRGEIFGFLGPNGAGKTTSINMICGLLKPDAGQVIIDGAPISGDRTAIRGRIGMCPQDVVLWERLTCIEQLQFMAEMYAIRTADARRRGDQLLEAFGLEEKRNAQARTLSGGMRKRLNLAMALVHDPEIAVLDEPEAGLDPQTRLMIRETIQSLAPTMTVILTTHNMDEADRVADRVAIIDHGRLLVLDSPHALKNSIGEGNLLEIELRTGEIDAGRIHNALATMDKQAAVEIIDGTLHIRSENALELLPSITQQLHALGIELGAIRMRENTLEDVFIHLTGRRLRA